MHSYKHQLSTVIMSATLIYKVIKHKVNQLVYINHLSQYYVYILGFRHLWLMH